MFQTRVYQPEVPEQKELFQLPFFKDEKSSLGVTMVYGPPHSGKTTLVAAMVRKLMETIDYYAIVIFCPGGRDEWDEISQMDPAKVVWVNSNEEHAMMTIVKNQRERVERRLPNKLLMIWDDQVGTTQMHDGILKTACSKFAACGRQKENNLTWFCCAQSPNFANPTVRQSARMVMFSQLGDYALDYVLEASQVFVSKEICFSLAFNYQFIVLDDRSHKAFIVKAKPSASIEKVVPTPDCPF